MTPQEVIDRFDGTRLLAYVAGDLLRIRYRKTTTRVADLPIVKGQVAGDYICFLISEIT